MKSKLKIHALAGCALAALLTWNAVPTFASSVSFVATSGPAQSLAFTLVNGRLQIALTNTPATVTPSATLQGVSWSMTNTPVLAVNQPGSSPAATTFPITPASNTQYTFATAVASTDLWKQFSSYSSTKGVSGPGSTAGGTTNTLQGASAAQSTAFYTSTVPVKVTLTLANSFDMTNNGNLLAQFNGPIQSIAQAPGPVAAVPVPPALWTGLPMLMGMAIYRRIKARRKSL